MGRTGRRGWRRRRGETAADLTPMVDVVFLLIVFFVLVAQISSDERLEMALPRLERAEAAARTGEERLVINVTEDSGRAFVIGRRSWADSDAGLVELSQAVRRARETGRADRVIVRAARGTASERALRALRAVSEAGVDRIDLAAAAEAGRNG